MIMSTSAKGTCNIFMAVEAKAGKRFVEVTDTRTKADFAYFIEQLIARFSKSVCIQLVLDNLNTHFESSLLETFGKVKTKKLMKQIKFIYTPKHASWLNMAEIETNIMDRQCTGGRIENKKKLSHNVQQWKKRETKTKQQLNGSSHDRMQTGN